MFDGFFENDKKNGYGILRYINGDKYDGEFINDIRQGKGLYYWKDGSRWEDILWIMLWMVRVLFILVMEKLMKLIMLMVI